MDLAQDAFYVHALMYKRGGVGFFIFYFFSAIEPTWNPFPHACAKKKKKK